MIELPDTGPWKRIERIGDAVLLLGDCLEILPHLPKVDAVITDPPYPKEFDHVWDILGQPCFNATKDDAFLMTMCGQYQVPRVLSATLAGGWSWFWHCIAENNNQAIMHGYKVKCSHKPCPVFRKGRAMPTRIFVDNFSLRVRTKDWLSSQAEHKWGQAESVFWEPVEAFCPEGGIVCDPFMGGATTYLACQTLHRQFIGIEIEPKYFDIACERIENAQRQERLFHEAPAPQQAQHVIDLRRQGEGA